MSLKYNINDYTPLGLQAVFQDEKELRKEYSKIRSIVRKRYERMDKSKVKSKLKERFPISHFKPLKDIKDERELRFLMSELASVYESKSSSITGIKKERNKTIEMFKEKGYDFINENNLDDFLEFMNVIKIYSESRIYDSERAVEVFKEGDNKRWNSRKMLNEYKNYINKRDKKKRNKKGIRINKQKRRKKIRKRGKKKRK